MGMKAHQLISPQAYLASEIESPVRREYVNGHIYPLPGDTIRHSSIAGNCQFALHRALHDSNYEVFGPSTKIRIWKNGRVTRFYYPDACVIGESNPDNDHFQDRPILIVEVLSSPPRELTADEIRGGYITDASLQSYQSYSTRRADEVEKRLAYQSIPSLKSYLLVEQQQPAVVHYRRTEERFLRTIAEGLDAEVFIPALSLSLPLRDIYEDVSFAAE